MTAVNGGDGARSDAKPPSGAGTRGGVVAPFGLASTAGSRRCLGLVGNDFPLVGSHFPVVGSDLPLVGNDFPVVGNDFPLVGNDFPQGLGSRRGWRFLSAAWGVGRVCGGWL